VDTESEQRLLNAEVTVAFVTVVLLAGLKADVAEVSEVRQVLRPASVFKLFRNVEQVVETEAGIRELGVGVPGAADDDEDWAKATEVNAEMNVRIPNILKTTKY
jgi:hypothetical protein